MLKGIDVSSFQGDINFQKVKADGIDFVIIYGGMGRLASQKSTYFEKNYQNARSAGLKIGAYWYSYAKSAAEAELEAKACIAAIGNKEYDLPIFLDMEESSQFALGQNTCSAIVKTFCDYLIQKGIRAGLYISYSPLMSHIRSDVRNAYPMWVAQYWNKCQYDGAAIWQYSDKGEVNGISTYVDMNYLYDQSLLKSSSQTSGTTSKSAQKSIDELAFEVLEGKWGNGNDRKRALIKANYNYWKVQQRVNEILTRKSIDTIAKEVIDGKWSNSDERKRRLTLAGYDYAAVQKRVNELVK